MHFVTSGLFVLCVAASVAAQQLDYRQRQAVERQERNLTEAKQKRAEFEAALAMELAEVQPDWLLPPAWLEQRIKHCDHILGKCDALLADLDANACPAGHPRVQAIRSWVDETRAAMAERKQDLLPKLEAMRKIADPKNYPDLDADFAKIDALGAAYRAREFRSRPERAEELLRDLQAAEEWLQAKWKHYRPLIVITGGKDSPLHGRYRRMADAIKGFRAEAGQFFADVRKELPRLLVEVREMVARAVAQRNPDALGEGVQRRFESAEAMLRTCRVIAPEHQDLQRMEQELAAAKEQVEKETSVLREQVIAAARPPVEAYAGADREQLRAQVKAAWQQAWPNDEVVAIRMHMEAFDRKERMVWDKVAQAWNREDRSVLCVLVIVKTDGRLATSYPAYVNVDHVANRTTIGVHTKGGGYVHRVMLLANVR